MMVKAGLVTLSVPTFESDDAARRWAAGCTNDRLALLELTVDQWDRDRMSYLIEAIGYETNRRRMGGRIYG